MTLELVRASHSATQLKSRSSSSWRKSVEIEKVTLFESRISISGEPLRILAAAWQEQAYWMAGGGLYPRLVSKLLHVTPPFLWLSRYPTYRCAYVIRDYEFDVIVSLVRWHVGFVVELGVAGVPTKVVYLVPRVP